MRERCISSLIGRGQDAVVTVELDPNRQAGLAKKPPRLFVVPPGLEREKTLLPDFQWIGPYTLRARFRMEETGTYRTLVQTEDGRLTRGPAVTLPYSPEYAPRPESESGRLVLAQVAELSGGQSRTDVLSILADPPRTARMLPLLPYLVIAAIVLLVTEIAGRRLSLWKPALSAAPDATTELSVDPALGYRQRWLSRRRKVPKQTLPERTGRNSRHDAAPQKRLPNLRTRQTTRQEPALPRWVPAKTSIKSTNAPKQSPPRAAWGMTDADPAVA